MKNTQASPATTDCRNCGGDGWVDREPQVGVQCPACNGSGKEPHDSAIPRGSNLPKQKGHR